MTGFFFGDKLERSHEAIGEVIMTMIELQCTGHTVAVEPVAVLGIPRANRAGPLEVIRPLNEIWDLAYDLLYGVR